MKGIDFPRKLYNTEFVAGIIYFFFHMFILPWLLKIIFGMMLIYGFPVTDIQLNATYQLIGFAGILLIMGKYLIANFDRFLNWLPFNLIQIIAGYIAYWALYFFLSFILATVFQNSLTNPNNEYIIEMTMTNLYQSIAITVLLAPLVEECMFRGVIFCGIGAKSRILGYLVSTLLFAFIHVYQYLFESFDPGLFVTMLLYVPSGLVLGRVYEKSGSIWCSVIIHMAINLTSLLLSYS